MATSTFGLAGNIVNVNKSYAGSDADLAGLLQWASVTYRDNIKTQLPSVQFTGSIAGTTLTVTAVAIGGLATNQFIFGPGVAGGTYITALGTGGGGPGTYTLNSSQTVAAQAMTSYGPDLVANGLFLAQMAIWIELQQNWQRRNVATPPPMGWT
jgi:hypothetical protein